MDTYDVVVIGAGIIGCAAAYELKKQGKKTLLVEQFPLPHTRGSSSGATRYLRMTYLEEFHTRIMMEASPMWKSLEKETGMELLKERNVLCYTNEEFSMLSKYHECAEKHSPGKSRMLDQTALVESYPIMSFDDAKYVGCVDQSAGVLYADRCLQAFQKAYLGKGGELIDNCKVRNIVPGKDVIVETDKGTLSTSALILTCGAWTGQLLEGLGVTLPLQAQAVQVPYWKAKDGVDHRDMPIFFNFRPKKLIFGLPSNEYDGLVKITMHHGIPCDPDSRDRVDQEAEAADLNELKEFVVKNFPNLEPEPAIKERCMHTTTPDNTCVVDRHPDFGNIAYATGFSGHGFKLAPAIGKMLTDLVEGKEPLLLTDEMRAKRFM